MAGDNSSTNQNLLGDEDEHNAVIISTKLAWIIGVVFLIIWCLTDVLAFYKDEIKTSGLLKLLRQLLVTYSIFFFLYAGYQWDFENTFIIVGVWTALWALLICRCHINPDVDNGQDRHIVVGSSNAFEDLASDWWSQVLPVGVGQLILIGFYAWGVYETGGPDFNNRRTCQFYFLGVMIHISYGISKFMQQGLTPQLYDEEAYWSRMLSSDTNSNVSAWKKAGCDIERFSPSKMEMRSRYILHIFVNTFGESLIGMLLPIHLATSKTPIEFVLNSVAVMFITELDDKPIVKYEPVHNETEVNIEMAEEEMHFPHALPISSMKNEEEEDNDEGEEEDVDVDVEVGEAAGGENRGSTGDGTSKKRKHKKKKKKKHHDGDVDSVLDEEIAQCSEVKERYKAEAEAPEKFTRHGTDDGLQQPHCKHR